jgi:hypothetical protein
MAAGVGMISWMNSAQARAGDTSPGVGLSTGNQTSGGAVGAATDVGMNVAPGLQGTTAGHPVTFWVGLVALLIALKYFAEWGGTGEDFRNIKIGFFNTMVITFSAVIGLVFLKWVFGFYKIPGVSDVVLAA